MTRRQPEPDYSRIRFPSGRTVLHDRDGDELNYLHYWERYLVKDAFLDVLGWPKSDRDEECHQPGIDYLLAGYAHFGLAAGQATAKQHLRHLQEQGREQAAALLGFSQCQGG